MNHNFRKILVSRTDRIGDVLLSTPVIKALKRKYPGAYIAMMVRPYAQDVILGNPYLDEVIIYDKYGKQRSFYRSLKFAWQLSKKRFDLALILHPTNRAHLITFLARIKKRIGFDKKMGFLLTDRIEHKKQQGQKHELEYTLDVLRVLEIEPGNKELSHSLFAQGLDLFMPIRKDSEIYIEEFLKSQGFSKGQRLVAIHPAGSCPSKIWPTERFVQLATRITEEFKIKVAVVAGPDDFDIGRNLIRQLHSFCIDAVGKTTVSQLASLLRRCCLFISNDSGPVHIACAVGVPTVAIFGRNQPGLSPRRWGPLGKNDIILHKDVGCKECLAHNCENSFACLKSISVEEVLNAASKLLGTVVLG